MSKKKTFVLRIDEALYKALDKWAGDEFRSVNGQIEWLISQRLREVGRLKGGGGAGGAGEAGEAGDTGEARDTDETGAEG